MIKLLCCVLFCVTISYSFATNYYMSNKGNDTNSGKSAAQAWKTIERLNNQKLLPGDSVFFKSNDVFRGQIQVQYSGNKLTPIVYKSYGKGSSPVISGTVQITNWSAYKGNVLSAKTTGQVFNLFVDNKMQINARYPNVGLLKMDGGYNNTISFFDAALTQKDGYWNDATIRFRTYDWEYRTSKVVEFTANKITIKDSSTNQLSSGWGYYFDNKFEELDTIKEWYFNKEKNVLYFYPESKNITKKSIEATIYSSGFILENKVQNIVIENLSIEKFEQYGIFAKGNNEGIKIINNHFSNINRTAIDFNLISKNCLVENNFISDINGRGISAVEPENIVIKGNKIARVGNIAGYGISGVNGMIGIVVENAESEKTNESHIATNNLIQNNVIDSIGYVGIRMDGKNSIMERNTVSNSLIQLSDGAAIYCWAKSKFYSHDNVIRNNIVFNVTGNNIGTPSESNPIANGIYIDNNCYNIKIENNTVFNSTGSGIHINSESYDNLITANTVYNCQSGLSIAEWSKPNTTYGNIFEKNTVFANNKTQRCVALSNWLIPSTKNFGTFDRNLYANLFEKYLMTENYVSADRATKILNEYSFDSWKKNYSFDLNSSALEYNQPIAQYQQSKLFYNDKETIISMDVSDKKYVDLDGNAVMQLQLKPFTSAILLFQ